MTSTKDSLQKWSFPSRTSSVNVTKSKKIADLVTFTEEFLTGKLFFLCSDIRFTWFLYNFYWCKIHRKTPVTKSSFNKVADCRLRPWKYEFTPNTWNKATSYLNLFKGNEIRLESKSPIWLQYGSNSPSVAAVKLYWAQNVFLVM